MPVAPAPASCTSRCPAAKTANSAESLLTAENANAPNRERLHQPARASQSSLPYDGPGHGVGHRKLRIGEGAANVNGTNADPAARMSTDFGAAPVMVNGNPH